jgi:hypothetical protein
MFWKTGRKEENKGKQKERTLIPDGGALGKTEDSVDERLPTIYRMVM